MVNHIVGTLYVHRYQDEGEWNHEVLHVVASASTMYCEAKEELELAFDGGINLPEQPGVYAVHMAVKVVYVEDYLGDWDVDFEDCWHVITRVSDEQSEVMFAEFGCEGEM